MQLFLFTLFCVPIFPASQAEVVAQFEGLSLDRSHSLQVRDRRSTLALSYLQYTVLLEALVARRKLALQDAKLGIAAQIPLIYVQASLDDFQLSETYNLGFAKGGQLEVNATQFGLLALLFSAKDPLTVNELAVQMGSDFEPDQVRLEIARVNEMTVKAIRRSVVVDVNGELALYQEVQEDIGSILLGFDRGGRGLVYHGHLVPLTLKQQQLMKFIFQSPHQVAPYAAIAEHMRWDGSHPERKPRLFMRDIATRVVTRTGLPLLSAERGVGLKLSVVEAVQPPESAMTPLWLRGMVLSGMERYVFEKLELTFHEAEEILLIPTAKFLAMGLSLTELDHILNAINEHYLQIRPQPLISFYRTYVQGYRLQSNLSQHTARFEPCADELLNVDRGTPF